MTPKEFLNKQGFTEFVKPQGKEKFSPSFQWGTVLGLLEQYKSEAIATEASKALPLLNLLTKIQAYVGYLPTGFADEIQQSITNYKK